MQLSRSSVYERNNLSNPQFVFNVQPSVEHLNEVASCHVSEIYLAFSVNLLQAMQPVICSCREVQFMREIISVIHNWSPSHTLGVKISLVNWHCI
jgi:hypothetical protein